MGRKKREYLYDDWKKAMDLHSRYKLGPAKISRVLGISQYTVKKWLYYGVVPLAAKWVARPGEELAYIIGILHHGDGTVCKSKVKNKNKSWYRYEYIIQLNTIDPEFAIMFSKIMAKLLNRKYIKPWWDKKKKMWCVKYCSKAFVIWYKKCKKRGLEEFKPFIEYDIETVRYYLKGLFDSDGGNYINKQVHLSNSNKELLKYVQYLLKEYFNIKSTGPYLDKRAGNITKCNGTIIKTRHDNYTIRICRKEHIQRFLNEVGFSITRKQKGLKRRELVKQGFFRPPFSDIQ